MINIKKVIPVHTNILIIDDANRLWIIGNNNERKMGVGKINESIYSPIYLGIDLDQDDDVKKFCVSRSIILILSIKGKVYILNNLNNYKSKPSSKDIDKKSDVVNDKISDDDNNIE
jgi:hypothetical protein